MEYELKHGQALVIAGPQGCGKSTLARKIAKQHGERFIEAVAHQLETPQGLNDLMVSEPGTIICDGLPKSKDAQAVLKAMIAGKRVKVERKHDAPKMVNAPNFIFCIGGADLLPPGVSGRRFRVINIGSV